MKEKKFQYPISTNRMINLHKIKYMVDNKSHLALEALRKLCISHSYHYIIWRKIKSVLTYPIPTFHAGDKLLVQNQIRYVWAPKYSVAYCMLSMMGQQLQLAEESGRIHEFHVQDVKVT